MNNIVHGYGRLTALKMELALIEGAKKEGLLGRGRVPSNFDPDTMGKPIHVRKPSSLSATKRDEILRLLMDGPKTLHELMETFDVSSMTMRRAMVALCQRGLVKWRVRNGKLREYYLSAQLP